MTSKKLNIKIGTKKEKLWTEVAKECKVLIENHTNSLIIQKEILALATRNIKEEQR